MKTRIAELDAIRAIAAMVIVVYHLWFIGCHALGTAVDLFFVLSGYLITTILLKQEGEGAAVLLPFYARRALRIWPIYYLGLLGVVIVHRLVPGSASLAGLPYYLTYTQKLPLYWFGEEPAFAPAFRHTWTLAIEEQFYLAWPALVLFGKRRSLAPICLSAAMASFVARGLGWSPWILLGRCDGLAMGCLLAIFRGERGKAGDRRGMAFGLVAILAAAGLALAKLSSRGLAGQGGEWARSLDLLLMNTVYAGLIGVVITLAGRPVLAPLRLKPLCYLGQISYGLYFYHHMIFSAIDSIAREAGDRSLPRPALDLVKLAASLAIAAASWTWIERPILSMKDWFRYRPTPVPEIANAGATS